MTSAPPSALHAIDVTGSPVDIRRISGRKGVVLLFFRSAKRRPYCPKQIMDFRDAHGRSFHVTGPDGLFAAAVIAPAFYDPGGLRLRG